MAPVFLGDQILDDTIEVAEYLSYMTGYSFDEICGMDEIMSQRINTRLLVKRFEQQMMIAQQSLLTAIADKKKSGKSTKPFHIDELLAFQGMNQAEIVSNRKLFEEMTHDDEDIERKKAKKAKKKETVSSIRQRLRDKYGINI
ncbi:hypothetical protein [Pseudolactococcus insecticola]|uniref:Uncharacterized protein n=1 Tax=Pseudolactococcus insecticola TaxID=2709158 RepID=A0A6A0B5N6_9LACT|nr:hypothetical protein [Lactococcus insecticola]GFH39851.1 hypothetical protein Hs20B_02490 [Lactococcus insecticola]